MSAEPWVEKRLFSSNRVSSWSSPQLGENEAIDAETLLHSTIRLLGQESLARHLSSELSEAQDYRIGLVPSELLTGHPDFSTPVPAEANSVLILPLTWKELVLHLRADALVRIGRVSLNFSRMEAHCSGMPVAFTALQFKVLHYFVRNPRRAISREELLSQVWGYNNYPTTRTVDNTLFQLRRRLEPDPAKPVYFHTVHRIGYRFTPEHPSSPEGFEGNHETRSKPVNDAV
jgi:DNA-binding winged helix-turn-helix (wHTH) protein